MKIRRLKIVLEPTPIMGDSGMKTLTAKVDTGCGQQYTHTEIFDEEDFQDVFGYLMKTAERRIRELVAKRAT